MKLGTLLSGGKDSVYSTYQALNSSFTEEKQQKELEVALSIYPENPSSWMFHSSNIEIAELQAKAMGVDFSSKESPGKKENEVEDLKEIVKTAINKYKIDGLVFGAIKSNYQRERVEKICNELNLELIAPIWKINEKKYLQNLLKNNFEVIISKVSAMGLDKSWLGNKLNKTKLKQLEKLNQEYRIHLSGEGGEYETLVLNCPLFNQKIEIEKAEKKWKGDHGFLDIEEANLVTKN